MKLRCKAGQKALVLGGKHTGKVVTCLCFIGSMPTYLGTDYWQVEACWEPHPDKCVARDSLLMPIPDGDPDTKTVVDKEIESELK